MIYFKKKSYIFKKTVFYSFRNPLIKCHHNKKYKMQGKGGVADKCVYVFKIR